MRQTEQNMGRTETGEAKMESSASRIRAALIAKTPGLAGYLDSIDDGALVDVANGKTSAVCEFVLKSGIAPNGKHCVIVGKMSGAGSGLDSFMSVRARADGGQEQRIMPQHVAQMMDMVTN